MSMGAINETESPLSAGRFGLCTRAPFLHRRQGREGSLHLSNGASLGGARFELRLP